MICTAGILAAGLAACGGSEKSYRDGTYEAQSETYMNDDGTDEGNGYGVVSVTIKDGKIADCTFSTFEPDGKPKDENYGMADGAVANRDFYNKAQKAVAACDEYASMLVANGELDGIDAISGATVNYDEFCDAVTKALAQAEE